MSRVVQPIVKFDINLTGRETIYMIYT
jgi:hypothetical protein